MSYTLLAKSVKRNADHELGYMPGRVKSASRLHMRFVFTQIALVCLAQNPYRDLGKIQAIPLLHPTKVQLAAWCTLKI